MPDNLKSMKRDQDLVRDTTDEILEETNQEHFDTRYENPNRDKARGDWDRSRKRNDVGNSRT